MMMTDVNSLRLVVLVTKEYAFYFSIEFFYTLMTITTNYEVQFYAKQTLYVGFV